MKISAEIMQKYYFGRPCKDEQRLLSSEVDPYVILTTSMNEDDLRDHIRVTETRKNGKTKKINNYKITADIGEGMRSVQLDVDGTVIITKLFFAVEDKLTYVEDFTFYTYDNDDYLLSYNGNAENLALPERAGGYAIFDGVFSGNDTLKSVELGDSVTGIGRNAFSGCTALERVVFGTDVEKICDGAFTECVSLKSVEIERLRDWCEIEFNAEPFMSDDSSDSELIYDEDGVEMAPVLSLSKARSLEYYNNASITVDGKSYSTYVDRGYICWLDDEGAVQRGGALLVSNPLYFAGSLTVGGAALEDLVIPDEITEIHGSAFAYTDIKSVTIHEGVVSIGQRAFRACKSLDSVKIYAALYKIERNSFEDTKSIYNDDEGLIYLGNEENPYLVCVGTINNSAYSIKIHDTTESIAAGAFRGMPNISSVVIPDSVKAIGSEAFWACGYLNDIWIGSGVTYIGKRAFYGNSEFVDIMAGYDEGWYYLNGQKKVYVSFEDAEAREQFLEYDLYREDVEE